MTTVVSSLSEEIELLTIRLATGEAEPTRSWVADPVCDVVERCQAAVANTVPSRLIISLLTPVANDLETGPIADAAVGALQGLVHSLTLEVGSVLAMNLVVAQDGTKAATQETVAFLASPAAEWIQGATFDLREDR